MGPSLIPQSLEENKRITDSPASIGVNPNEFFVFCRNLIGISVPFQPALFKVVGFLDKGDFQVQSWLGDGISHRSSKLGDNDLLCFRHNVESIKENDEKGERYNDGYDIPC
jgi:hypothetical protein